jgi:hypothetical protein
MISRYLVIALAFGVALYRASQGAWIESSGLFALGAGLVVLRLAETRPAIKPVAYGCFLGTAFAIGVVLLRRYQS